ncbi:hypothetical protein FRC11_014617, partial [Ceratobasidium sp. 423]
VPIRVLHRSPELYESRRGAPDPSISVIDDTLALLWNVRSELHTFGLHRLSIASSPVPKQHRMMYSGDEAWPVILGTGFDKTHRVPHLDKLTARVRTILCAKDEPSWLSLELFGYPHPK